MVLAKRPKSLSGRIRLQLEDLESRLVPAYTLSGNAWVNPQVVTISFVPDGTVVGTSPTGPVYSNLFAQMNKTYGSPSVWEGLILKGAQAWAKETNLNFTVITDNGSGIGQGSYQQGDPNMGDIRIGGYGFSNGWLGQAYMPAPANNYSISGDVQLNTAASWKYNGRGTYDLWTVASHEIGHALGLFHGTVSNDVMFGTYNGPKTALAADDVNGIEAIYSNGQARSPDIYNTFGLGNGTLLTAADLTLQVDQLNQTALVQNLQLNSPTQSEYFSVLAPLLTSSNLTVNVQSTGLSLLTPTVTVYDSDGFTVLGSQTSAGNQNGATLSVNVSGVTPLHLYYIKVTGADSSVMSTGTYAMTLNFGTGASPTVPLPNTTLANGNPLQGGGAQALLGKVTSLLQLKLASLQTGMTMEGLASMSLNQADALSISQANEDRLDRLVSGLAHPSNGGASGFPVIPNPWATPAASLSPFVQMPFLETLSGTSWGQLTTLVDTITNTGNNVPSYANPVPLPTQTAANPLGEAAKSVGQKDYSPAQNSFWAEVFSGLFGN